MPAHARAGARDERGDRGRLGRRVPRPDPLDPGGRCPRGRHRARRAPRHRSRRGDRDQRPRPRPPLHARGGRGRRARERVDPAGRREPVRDGRRDGHLDLSRARPRTGRREGADDDQVRRAGRRAGAGLSAAPDRIDAALILARTAVLGGSFNPIHYGHLLLADDVAELLGLDRVLFVPAGSPPHKPPTLLAPAADRFEMVRLAIADHPRFAVSDVELRRAGPSYTVDTLSALAAAGDELFYIVGSETFLDLLTWREPRRVAGLARLVVIPRAGSVFDTEGAAAQKVLHEIGVQGGFVH